MAEYLNISVAYMSRIECGRTHLNLPMLNRISDYLDTSEAYLLNGLVMECHSPLQQEICRLAASCPPGRQLLLLEVLRAFSRPE
jgi:transcriptional regulator with XRE-family HTH domain